MDINLSDGTSLSKKDVSNNALQAFLFNRYNDFSSSLGPASIHKSDEENDADDRYLEVMRSVIELAIDNPQLTTVSELHDFVSNEGNLIDRDSLLDCLKNISTE